MKVSRAKQCGIGLIVVLLAGGGIYWAIQATSSDPMAVKVRELVSALPPSGSGRGGGETIDKLARLGPEAAPYLNNILKSHDTRLDKFYDSIRRKVPQSIRKILPIRYSKDELRQRLAHSMRDMGPMVSCLVSGTTRALELSGDYGRSRELLRCLYWSIPGSSQATDALRQWLSNPKPRKTLFGITDARALWPQVPDMAPLLIDWLKLPDQAGDAANALGAMGTNAVAAVPHLVDVYQNGVAGEEPNLELAYGYADHIKPILGNRRSAVGALGQIGKVTPEVKEVLLSALSHTNRQIRASAANAVGNLGKKGVPFLSSLLENLDAQNREVLQFQLEALGKMGLGASNAIPVLRKWARPKDHGVTIPKEGEIGHAIRPEGTSLPFAPIPSATLSDRPPSIPVAAALSLWRIEHEVGKDHTDVLAQGLTNHIPYSALSELKPLSKELIEEVGDGLNQGSEWNRLNLAFRILSLNPHHAAARRQVQQAMQSEDPSLKSMAACYFYLSTGETERVLPVFEDALVYVQEDPDQTPVRCVAWLGDAGKPLVPEIKPLLTSENQFVRSTAGNALRSIDPTALPSFDGK